jgi:hypothetical protein
MAAEFDLNVQLRQLLEAKQLRLQEIESRLREAREEKVTLEDLTLMTIEAAIEAAADRFREHPEDLDLLEEYEALVAVIRDAQIPVDMRHPQNEYYIMMSTVRPAIEAGSNGQRWVMLFDSLGEKLSISREAEAS